MYWGEVFAIEIYTLNNVQKENGTSKTPQYELKYGHVPTIKYFRIFKRKCYIKRDDDLGKFNPRSNEGISLGHYSKSKGY